MGLVVTSDAGKIEAGCELPVSVEILKEGVSNRLRCRIYVCVIDEFGHPGFGNTKLTLIEDQEACSITVPLSPRGCRGGTHTIYVLVSTPTERFEAAPKSVRLSPLEKRG